MREKSFELYLRRDPKLTSELGIASRLRHANEAEEILKTPLDVVVADDDRMYEALSELKKHETSVRGQMQNALRKYYLFCNGKEFPRLKQYHSPKHP
jgi:hypothetical protein